MWFRMSASRLFGLITASASCPTNNSPSIPARWTITPRTGLWVSCTTALPVSVVITPVSPSCPPDSA